jgi:hypothetical protein
MLFPDFFDVYKMDALFLLISFGLGLSVLVQLFRGKMLKSNHVIVAIGSITVSGLHAWSDYDSFSALKRWNALNPEHIVSIQIEKSERLEPSGGTIETIHEQSTIQEGIQTLLHAQPDAAFYRALKDGYRLTFQIIDEDAPFYLSLSVYRVAFNDFTDVPVTIVIPHSENRPDERKAYRRPEFHEWVHQYVDPLFTPAAQNEATQQQLINNL